MQWYWWVLIGVGVVLLGWLKLTVLNRWMASRKANQEPIEEE
ncbi:MAG: hypothetical protein ACLFNT_14035 [Spirochaetales bacterium]